MSTISDIASAVLAQVDRELATPYAGTCLVCGDESERDYCCAAHRHELWCLRRGLRSQFSLYDMRGGEL